MALVLTEEQELLKQTAAEFFHEKTPVTHLRALRDANWFLGPLFFMVFVTLGFFVLINMLIAIISDAYIDTKAELEKGDTPESRFKRSPIRAEGLDFRRHGW